MGVSVQEQSCSARKLRCSLRRAEGLEPGPSAHPAQNCGQSQARGSPVPEESAVLRRAKMRKTQSPAAKLRDECPAALPVPAGSSHLCGVLFALSTTWSPGPRGWPHLQPELRLLQSTSLCPRADGCSWTVAVGLSLPGPVPGRQSCTLSLVRHVYP